MSKKVKDGYLVNAFFLSDLSPPTTNLREKRSISFLSNLLEGKYESFVNFLIQIRVNFLPLKVAALVQVSDWPCGNSEFAVARMDLQLKHTKMGQSCDTDTVNVDGQWQVFLLCSFHRQTCIYIIGTQQFTNRKNERQITCTYM